jgi:N utilization substance protein B
MTTKNRRPARQIALQALYEIDSTNHALEEVAAQRLAENQIDDELRIFTQSLIRGVREKQAVIDRLIQQFAPEWPLDQVAVIDRNLIRMAIYEVIFMATPPGVAINEAVELAKEYGSESASRFVNGVLGTFAAQSETLRPMIEETNS